MNCQKLNNTESSPSGVRGRITLVRHTSVDCGPTVCYGQTDVDISATFETEALKVKQSLDGRKFDAIYTSPLQRCTKLASFCGFDTPIWDKRLMELNFGDWEGIPWAEITDPRIDDWYKDWINTKTTNGESFADQVARVRNFLDELKTLGHSEVLIFTHAGIIRAVAILQNLIDIHLAFADYKVEYGEIHEFNI